MHESEPETPAALPAGSINYERLYAYRFRDIDQAGRQAVWQEIASFPGPAACTADGRGANGSGAAGVIS
jgi:hypothetical protein